MTAYNIPKGVGRGFAQSRAKSSKRFQAQAIKRQREADQRVPAQKEGGEKELIPFRSRENETAQRTSGNSALQTLKAKNILLPHSGESQHTFLAKDHGFRRQKECQEPGHGAFRTGFYFGSSLW